MDLRGSFGRPAEPSYRPYLALAETSAHIGDDQRSVREDEPHASRACGVPRRIVGVLQQLERIPAVVLLTDKFLGYARSSSALTVWVPRTRAPSLTWAFCPSLLCT